MCSAAIITENLVAILEIGSLERDIMALFFIVTTAGVGDKVSDTNDHAVGFYVGYYYLN